MKTAIGRLIRSLWLPTGSLVLAILSAGAVLLPVKNPRNWNEIANIWKLEELRKEEARELLELSQRYYLEGKGEWFEGDDEIKIQMALNYANTGLNIPGLPRAIKDQFLELKLKCEKEL